MPEDAVNIRELHFHPANQILSHPFSNIASGVGLISWAIFGALKLADAAWFSLTFSVIVSAACSIAYAFERAHFRQSSALAVFEVMSYNLA
jgi:hypothetical protein